MRLWLAVLLLLATPSMAGMQVRRGPMYSGSAVCGNGVRDGSDQCDGSDLGTGTCVNQGYASGTLACTGSCIYNFAGCVASVCGNDVLETGEVCDTTKFGADTCTAHGCTGGSLTCSGSCLSVDVSACTGCPTYADITFWTTFEANDVTGTYDMGADECSGMLNCTAGDTSGTYTGTVGTGSPGISTSAGATKNGTYGLRVTRGSTAQMLAFSSSAGDAAIVTPAEGSMGFWFENTVTSNRVLRLMHVANTVGQMKLDWYGDAHATTPNMLRYTVVDGNSITTNCDTAINALTLNVWSYVEVKWDYTSHTMVIKTTPDGGSTTTVTCTAANPANSTAASPATLVEFGEVAYISGTTGAAVMFFDNFEISSLYSRDLTALRDVGSSPR